MPKGVFQQLHCDLCNREIFSNVWPRHERSCTGPKVPKKRVAWNKGLFTNPPRTTPIGQHGGYRDGAGRGKKIRVLDSFGTEVCLQSTHELRVAELLNERKLLWKRDGCFEYDGRKYFPDFHLIESDIYLDVKNDYLIKVDAEKIRKVREQNAIDLRVFTIDQVESHLPL
jgi:hypothetical protein